MTVERLLAVTALCLILCLAIAITADSVFAQSKDLASKQGMDVLNNDKVWKKPNKVQAAVGLGSIPVMIAVLRWL